MEITDISVRTLFDSGRLRAVLSITFDDAFVVHNVKVIQGEKNLFGMNRPKRRERTTGGAEPKPGQEVKNSRPGPPPM